MPPQNLNALKRLPFGKQLPIFIGSKLTLFPLNNNLAAYPFRHGKLFRKLEKRSILSPTISITAGSIRSFSQITAFTAILLIVSEASEDPFCALLPALRGRRQ